MTTHTQPPNASESPHGPCPTEQRSRKRRAEDSLSNPSSKRRRISKISLALSLYQPPHPLSIDGLIRKHCRNRLYVHPLQWTAQHLELLGYRFVRRDGVEIKRRSQHRNQLPRPSTESIYTVIAMLRQETPPWFKGLPIRGLLAECDVKRLDGCRLPFDFRRQTVTTVPTSGLFSHHSNTASLAYLDLGCLRFDRDKSIGLSMSKRLNGPVRQIKQKRQRQLQPSHEAEDPYVGAVLIALAQGLRRHQQRSDNGPNESSESTKPDPAVPAQQNPTDFEVRLLALSGDAGTLYFYTASIPSTWLDTLNEPSLYYNAGILPISCYSVPLKACRESARSIRHIIRSL